MQLNILTDYAIRMVLYLAAVDRPASANEISAGMSIPQSSITTAIFPILRKTGIIAALRGTNGGYVLARRPDKISLGEIIKLMEGTTRINHCMEDDHYCSRGAIEDCPVRKFYVQIQAGIDKIFQEQTVATLLQKTEL